MEERLYLFEVIIDSIFFEESVTEIPQKKQIVVSVKLGNIVTLEIRSDTLPIGGEGGNKRLIDFKSGKSHLMPFQQENLLQALNSHSLEVSVGVRGDVIPIGTSSAPWDDCFKEMVQESHEEFVTPASIFDDFCLMDNGVIKGNVQMFLRLSCFGKSIQTQFEVMHESGNKQFLFKTPNTATSFICSKHGAGTSTDFLPIGPLYPLYNATRSKSGEKAGTHPSWMAFMEGKSSSMVEKRSSLTSECLFPEYLNIVPPVKNSAITFDIVSLQARPEEDKFLDFLTGKRFEDWEGELQSYSLADRLNVIQKILDNLKLDEDESCENLSRVPLRLRGGGLSARNLKSGRLSAGAPYKSPIAECQEIMEQFDKILEQYRKALSPCGQITCNYIPNITEGLCKTSCGIMPDSTNTAGCGLPNCQYAKYKEALMAMDADIEKQFIGPAILGNCGHPKCSYRADPVLPPIHWDCPEPLPTGKCRNPHCPYTQEIKNQERFASTKGPCGSDQCPYAPPAPCSSPNCPFRNPPACATIKESSHNVKNTTKSEDKICAGCPFTNPPQIVNMVFCDNPNCENMKAASAGDCGKRDKICDSPNCPYKSIQNKCSNPNCPFAQSESKKECLPCPVESKQEVKGACSNPSCPYADASSGSNTESSSSTSSACSNPDCPFRSKSKEEPQQEACANPECPFNIPSVESCKNPECPFLNKESSDGSIGSCDNPECPYKKSSKTSGGSVCECDNPLCPAKNETCGNPNCPFNLKGLGVCTNPDCPHKKDALGRDLGFCATPDPSFNEYCADKTCPFHDKRLDKAAVGEDGDAKSFIMTGSQEAVEQGRIEKTQGDRPSTYNMAPCTIKTCKFMGGNLTCVECGVGTDGKKRGPCPKTCPGDPICPLATARKKRRQRRRDPMFKRICAPDKKKLQKYGDMEYPGYRIGHRECVIPYFFVPPRMGWLWNIHTPCLSLKPRRGWRPGAITRSVARAILKHKKADQNHTEEKKVRKRRKDDDSENELICPKPTLEIKKREGIYHITMNPLKDPDKLQMNENPYLDCTPMEFKVAKNNIMDPNTVCTDEGEYYKYDSSSDDELDIQITTPAGIIHPDRPTQKKDVSVKLTQYNIKDLPAADKGGGKKKGKKGKGKKGKDKAKK